jgi:hypothetical protein
MKNDNPGYDPTEIEIIKAKCKKSGKNFVLNQDEEQSEEFAHFLFVGKHEGTEVIYDTAMFTLHLYHSSLLMEKSEEAAEKQFPGYKRPQITEDGELLVAETENEEIEIFKMELIDEWEETEAVKVQEYLDIDTDFDYGIALEIALNVEEITEQVITDFVTKFNTGTLKLDTTLYSFKTEEDED